MKNASILIPVVYGLFSIVCIFIGFLFPILNAWSYWTLCVCGVHAFLSMIISASSVADGGKIAMWFWHAISCITVIALILIYALFLTRIILIAAMILTAFTIISTIVFLVLIKTPTLNSND
jgi:hypothetical protein